MFKEGLRQIYTQAKTSYNARRAFARWCKAADKTEIPELKMMAKTIRSKIDDIVTYWTFSGISNKDVKNRSTLSGKYPLRMSKNRSC